MSKPKDAENPSIYLFIIIRDISCIGPLGSLPSCVTSVIAKPRMQPEYQTSKRTNNLSSYHQAY